MFDVMKTPSLHEAMIKIGAYVLSEFGYLIQQDAGKSMHAQFNLIKSKLQECSPQGKAILLTAFMKMTKHSAEIKPDVIKIFELHRDHWDIEIQQRSCEYLMMLSMQESSNEFISGALDKMPNFSEEIQTNNVLTKRILALKVKDGFHINMKEAEQQLQEKMRQQFAQPKLDDIYAQSYQHEETKQATQPSPIGDLLGFGDV